MKPHTVYACESQPVVVEGLKKVLASSGEFSFCGAAANQAEALNDIAALKPDLALLDHSFGLRTALELAGEIRTLSPETRSVLWATEVGEMETLRALQAGIRGIVRRNRPVAILLQCLHSVMAGNVWLENPPGRPAPAGDLLRAAPRFTRREREVVELVCRGYKNRQIAEALSITPGTVKVHLMHVFEKTGVRDRFELAMQGARLLEQDAGRTGPPPVDDGGGA